jgi:hypothetical protein
MIIDGTFETFENRWKNKKIILVVYRRISGLFDDTSKKPKYVLFKIIKADKATRPYTI